MSHIECVSSNITVVQRGLTPALRVKHCLSKCKAVLRSDDGHKCYSCTSPDNVFIRVDPDPELSNATYVDVFQHELS